MDELIKIVSEKTGLPQEQAKMAADGLASAVIDRPP